MFNEEQIEKLRKNPNVKHVSTKSITYQEQFKEKLVREYEKGKNARQVLIETDLKW